MVDDVTTIFVGGALDKGVWRACVRQSGVGGAVTWHTTVCSSYPRLRLAHVGTHDEPRETA